MRVWIVCVSFLFISINGLYAGDETHPRFKIPFAPQEGDPKGLKDLMAPTVLECNDLLSPKGELTKISDADYHLIFKPFFIHLPERVPFLMRHIQNVLELKALTRMEYDSSVYSDFILALQARTYLNSHRNALHDYVLWVKEVIKLLPDQRFLERNPRNEIAPHDFVSVFNRIKKMFNSEWFVDISVKQLTGATLLKLVDKLNSETAKPLRESTIGLQDDGSGEFQFEDLQGLAFLPLLNTSIQQSGDVNYYLRTKMNQKELTEQERIEVRSIILNWTETLVHLIDLDLSIKFNNSERDLRLKALIEGLLSLASNKNESFVRFGATTFNHAPSGLLAHFRLNIERLCEYCMKN